ncbi:MULTISPECIES: hypothetical protein [Bifidobacterium]|uniref:hypothetical protein n=1 Tax=Bifidobacterium TaxID=1678 RepID=UPI001BDBCEC6|nr:MULTISPECIES: hypothetical protein [Bifidobacterium]MBT1170741.1 hypothetical protein [Bifidobacterium sp. SO4]MBW3091087.1 hypothetical protein [Bifidobacterium miconisargentati]
MANLPSLGRMIDSLMPFYPPKVVTLKDWLVLHYMADHVKTSGDMWTVYRFFGSRDKWARNMYPDTAPANAVRYIGKSLRHLAAAGLIEQTQDAGRGRTAEYKLLIAERYKERRHVVALLQETARVHYELGIEIAKQCRDGFTPRKGLEPVAVPQCLIAVDNPDWECG